jgi:hypothetical protein
MQHMVVTRVHHLVHLNVPGHMDAISGIIYLLSTSEDRESSKKKYLFV